MFFRIVFCGGMILLTPSIAKITLLSAIVKFINGEYSKKEIIEIDNLN
jgi:hypothetical protein